MEHGIITPEDAPVAYLRERDYRLRLLIEHVGAITCFVSESGFANLAHSIIEQMLSTKVAATMEQRLRALCGGQITPETLGALAVEDIRSIGVSQRKAESLAALAARVSEEDIAALADMSDDEVMAWLTALPGIGEWTAHMFMLFSLQRDDILPTSDLTFRRAFAWLYGTGVEEAGVRTAVCELWHPYSSYAARYLYVALDDGLVQAAPAAQLLGF